MTDSMQHWDKESIRCTWNVCCTEKYSKNDRATLKGQRGQFNEEVSLAKSGTI